MQFDSVSPFAELRAELMSVSPGGPLEPNFVVYGVTGRGSDYVSLRVGYGF